MVRVAGVLVCLALAACSLQGLDEFELPKCESDEDCARGVAAPAGLPKTCRAYACVEGTCERLAEGCDGSDNDCDGRVDEGVFLEAEASVLASDLRADLPILWGETGAGTAFSFVDSIGARLQSVAAAPALPSPLTFQSHASDALSDATLEATCKQSLPDGIMNGKCFPFELAFDSQEGPTFFADVDRISCPAGTLYAGLVEGEARQTLVARGPLRRSNVFSGIDVDPQTSCSGASRKDGKFGSSAVSLSAAGDQALLASLAAKEDVCSDDAPPVAVEVLMLFHYESATQPAFGFVSGSNEGKPQVIGSTRSRSRPALLRFGAGFLLAYADTRGDIAIHYLPRAAPPPPNDGISGEASSRVGVEIPALKLPPPIVVLPFMQAPSETIALALDDADADSTVLAVAATEGCASRASLRLFTLDAQKTGPTLRSLGQPWVSEAVEPLPAVGLRTLDVQPTRSGFAQLSSKDASTAESVISGFYLSWTARDEIRVFRISDRDGQPVDPTPLVVPAASDPHVYTDGQSQLLAYREPARSSIKVRRFCQR